MNRFPQVEMVGVEIEVQNLLITGEIKNTLNMLRWTLTRDASVETNQPDFLGKPIYRLDNRGSNLGTRTNHFGGEIYSPPINPNTPDFIANINKVTSLLQNEGISSPRASLHVHVNVGDNLNLLTLQSMVRWATRLEALFFRIGCFGEEHRGIANNYNYCRPITKQGPLVILTPKGYGQVFNTEELVRAESVEDFWDKYGDLNRTLDRKYNAVRYHWFNLLSIFRHGTLEFRSANLTVNPYYIRAYVNFCQAVVQTMLTTSYKDLKQLGFRPVNSLYSPSASDCEDILEYIFDSYPIGDPTIKEILKRIYRNSDFPPIKGGYYKTHLFSKFEVNHFREGGYIPPLLPKEQVNEAVFIDDHQAEANLKEIPNVPTHLNLFNK